MLKTGNFLLFEGLGKRRAHQIYKDAVEDTLRSEELGFAGVHPAEHHFTADYGIMPRTQIFLSFLGGKCRLPRLCPMVIVAPLDHPLRVAEDVALLDNLLEGRIVCSLGSGYRPSEFRGLGFDVKESTARVREIAEITLKAWTEERFSYKGAYYDVPEVGVHPKPFTKPHPPVWITTGTDTTIKWAAEHGVTVLDASALGPAHVKRTVDLYMSAAKRPQSEIEFPFMKWIYVDETDQKALETGVPAFMATLNAFYNDGLDLWKRLAQKMARTNPESFLKRGLDPDNLDLSQFPQEGYYQGTSGSFVAGSPETVREKLKVMRDAGGTYFIGGFSMAGLSREQIRKSMTLYAKRVMPLL